MRIIGEKTERNVHVHQEIQKGWVASPVKDGEGEGVVNPGIIHGESRVLSL